MIPKSFKRWYFCFRSSIPFIMGIFGLAPTLSSAQVGNIFPARAFSYAEIYAPPPPFTGTVSWEQKSSEGIRNSNPNPIYYTTFPSAIHSPYLNNDTVPMWIYEPVRKPSSGKMKAVLLLHYLGALNLNEEISLAHDLNAHRIAAIIIALPYHLSRTPPGSRSGQLFIQPDINALLATTQQSIWDCRRAIEIASKRPEISTADLGISGISLGSLIAELLFGIDRDFKYGSFLLGGGDIAKILWRSSATVSVQRKFKEDGLTLSSISEALSSIEPTSAIKSRVKAGELPPGSSLVISAKFDQVVPPFSSDDLRDSLNKPYVINIDTGHYGGAFIQRRLETEVSKFFASKLSGELYQEPLKVTAPTLRLGAQFMSPHGLDIGVGIDLFRSKELHPTFSTFFVTPRGVEIFIGKELSNGFSFGVVGGTRGAGIGVFWSAIL